MEFKAIVDAKARNETGCAVVGVYEDGDLGTAARRIDAQLSGLIGKLHGDGDFSAKLGDILFLPVPVDSAHPLFEAGRVPWNVVIYEYPTELKIDALGPCLGSNHYTALVAEVVHQG